MARTKQTARKSTDPAKRPRKQLATKDRLQMHADKLTIWTNQSVTFSLKYYLKTKLRLPGGELLRKLHAESKSIPKNHLTEKISKFTFTRFFCQFIPVQPFL